MECQGSMLSTEDLIHCSGKAKWKVESNHNIKNFDEGEIESITSNYSTLIGKGGFGEVYRGLINDFTTDVSLNSNHVIVPGDAPVEPMLLH